MNERNPMPDREARDAAETTFDQNVVVVAGAGTGKTTLLVNRMVHLMMKEPRPVRMTEIIALTFTNKAATEMKLRLRERLSALVGSRTGASHQPDAGAVSAAELRRRYGLTSDEIADRAEAALQDIEKAQIGTLHSFAAHLLRLHPLESGVDPAFQEDDGLRFEEHFAERWDIWLDRELSRHGTHHARWRQVLQQADVESIRDITEALCSELVDLERLREQLDAGSLPPAALEWIRELARQAKCLLDSHDRPKRRKIEELLAACHNVLSGLAECGPAALSNADPATRDCLRRDPGKVADWEDDDYEAAAQIIKCVQQFLAVDHVFFNHLLQLVVPLVHEIRETFADKGWLSFDALLARARRLLWENPAVRERIKREYRAVLVDEFQDTDPIQYEIILAVAEEHGRCAEAWQDVVVEPGKLFIVGDPKQSIYAFRRADIEAFDRVVEKIAAAGGTVRTLTTNFRSDAAVLGPINEVFDRLFVRRPLVQPENVRLEARPQRRASALETGVRLLLTAPAEADGTFDAAGAVRAEGEVLARWLKEDVLSRPNITAGQVALLFRKLTQAEAYLHALRCHGIPYVIEGEKHFYRRQEVIDLVNVLRVIDHPHDRIALAAVLRSPLGGLTDRDLFEFHEAGLLKLSIVGRLQSFDHPRAPAVRRLFAALVRLRREAAAYPVEDAIQMVFDRLPLLELAAASLHAEQAVANLLKVKQTAASLSDRAHLTLGGFVDLMIRRLDEQPEEAESPLAEESSDAVQILTIHKAKGLEFPIVVLPGLHQGSGRDRSVPAVAFDWSSGIYGLSLADRRTLGAVLAQAKFAVREAAERRRVLYVGMTRAKELLILSGGVATRAAGETTLDWLQAIGKGTMGDAALSCLEVGACSIPHRVVRSPARKSPKRTLSRDVAPDSVDPEQIARLWRERSRRWDEARTTASHLTPTSLAKSQGKPGISLPAGAVGKDVGRLVGVVAHRLLERWNFQRNSQELLDRIAGAVAAFLSPEQIEIGTEVTEALHELLASFTRSAPYQRLRSATILGRELPFLMPWEEGQLMEGVIDLIYRLDGRIWIADYKTDRIEAEEAQARADDYAQQAAIYRAAAERCLREPIGGFQFIFLRPGVMVER